MDELISRQEALKEIADYQGGSVNKVVAKELLEALPAKQPTYIPVATIQFDEDKMREIIDKVIVRCKDCTRQCICYHSDNYFCSEGERING